MTTTQEKHVSERQLLQAVVDAADLNVVARKHLSVCEDCRRQKERLEKELAVLGKAARRSAPPLRKRVTLPESESRRGPALPWWRTAAVGIAAAASLVAAVFWYTGAGPADPATGKSIAAWDTLDDERFMAEVQLLTENILPQVYLDIAGESDPGMDEAFIQFVVPSVEDDLLSYDPENRRRVS